MDVTVINQQINSGNSDDDTEDCIKCLNKFSLSEENTCCSFVDDTDKENDNGVLPQDGSICLGDKIVTNNNGNLNLNQKSNHYKNIKIIKSQNVHVGDVFNINGPIYVNEYSPTFTQNITINNNMETFPMVSRRTWLAQPPVEPHQLRQDPAKYVIICHSASEDATTQTGNNLLVRLIQQFHVESRGWDDIGYNFLAGADGSIYEGRGWWAVGAHTQGYNLFSVGICFVGCYVHKLPPKETLQKVQDLIRFGVESGAVARDYSLVGHCQCISTESPGRRLFQEVKKWDRWCKDVEMME